jgi:hypothetical protein
MGDRCGSPGRHGRWRNLCEANEDFGSMRFFYDRSPRRRIVLSPSEEEMLAELSSRERTRAAHAMGLDDPYRGTEEGLPSLALVRGVNRELDRRIDVFQAWLLVGGVGLIVTAGLVLGATLIPEATQNTPVRIACGLGLLGFVALYFGLAAIYLSKAGRRRPNLPEQGEPEAASRFGRELPHVGSRRESEPSREARRPEK